MTYSIKGEGFMKRRLVLSLLMIMMVVSLARPVFAADMIYRLTHNDHNLLAITEVVEIEDEFVKFKVEDTVVSEADLDISNKKEQYRPDEVVINKNELKDVNYELGDKYLISLDKTDVGYEIAWGIFEIDSLDKKTLDVLYPDNASQGEITDSIILKFFVNSDGSETEFTVDEDNRILLGDEVVYDGGVVNVAEESEEGDGFNKNIFYIIVVALVISLGVVFASKKKK